MSKPMIFIPGAAFQPHCEQINQAFEAHKIPFYAYNNSQEALAKIKGIGDNEYILGSSCAGTSQAEEVIKALTAKQQKQLTFWATQRQATQGKIVANEKAVEFCNKSKAKGKYANDTGTKHPIVHMLNNKEAGSGYQVLPDVITDSCAKKSIGNHSNGNILKLDIHGVESTVLCAVKGKVYFDLNVIAAMYEYADADQNQRKKMTGGDVYESTPSTTFNIDDTSNVILPSGVSPHLPKTNSTSDTPAISKPTAAQVIGTVLLACTGIGLIIGLVQLLVTAIHAHRVNTNNDTANTATAGFLLCKLPELKPVNYNQQTR